MTVLSEILRAKAVYSISAVVPQNVFFVFLMQFGLLLSAAFVSSPVHCLLTVLNAFTFQ